MPNALRLLLVSKDPNEQGLVLRELLREFPGMYAVRVLDASELKDAIDQGGYDLAVVDFRLLWSNGIAVMANVKQQIPDCSVIMLTHPGGEEVAAEVMKVDLDDYVVKRPQYLTRLRATVRAVLKHSYAARQVSQESYELNARFDRMNLGLFRCKAHGKLLNANQTFLELLGADAPASNRAREMFASFVRLDDCADLFKRLEQSRQPQDALFQWQSAEGLPVRIKLSATSNDLPRGGTVIDGIVDVAPSPRPIPSDEREQQIVQARLELLSPREHDVMHYVVAGKTNKAIAQSLGISAKTVEMHRSNMMKKLHVNSLAELVRLVICTQPDR